MRLLTLLAALLTAACSSDNSRYQDNANLERPPEMPIPQSAELATDNELEPPIRRHGKGLKSDVYQLEGVTGMQLKRSFDETWSLLHQAIIENELKVTDEDRSKGLYYIAYGSTGLFSKAVSMLDVEIDKDTYLVKVEPQGEETKVTVSLANKEEQTAPKTGTGAEETSANDQSQDLLDLLFDTLHDKVKND